MIITVSIIKISFADVNEIINHIMNIYATVYLLDMGCFSQFRSLQRIQF